MRIFLGRIPLGTSVLACLRRPLCPRLGYGVPVGRALMIGDTEYDAAMARAIGMPMLGVTCGVHAPRRIIAAGAMALIESVADLPAWLRS